MSCYCGKMVAESREQFGNPEEGESSKHVCGHTHTRGITLPCLIPEIIEWSFLPLRRYSPCAGYSVNSLRMRYFSYQWPLPQNLFL
jgi:hypothetical protein